MLDDNDGRKLYWHVIVDNNDICISSGDILWLANTLSNSFPGKIVKIETFNCTRQILLNGKVIRNHANFKKFVKTANIGMCYAWENFKHRAFNI